MDFGIIGLLGDLRVRLAALLNKRGNMTTDSVLQYVVNFIGSLGMLNFLQAILIVMVSIFVLKMLVSSK